MKKRTKANVSGPRFSIRGQLLLVLVCLVVAWLGFWAYTVLADVQVTNTATMRISPGSSQVGAGETFSVTVGIDSVTNLGAFEFELNYNNTSIVQVTEPYTDHVTLGPFLGSTGRTTYPLGPNICGASCIRYGAYSLGSSGGPGGSGTLATITFDAVGLGTTPLSLQNVQITDTGGNALAVNVQHGEVVVGEGPGEDFFVYLPIVLKSH